MPGNTQQEFFLLMDVAHQAREVKFYFVQLFLNQALGSPVGHGEQQNCQRNRYDQ
jgi:hypothetical protein